MTGRLLADAAENIARYIAHNPDAVGRDLDELAAAGLVTAHSLGGLSVHRLTDDAEMRALLARFVEACADRHFRMRAIYYLVRAGRV